MQTRGRRGAGSFIPAALQHHHQDRRCELLQNPTCRGRAYRQLDPGQVEELMLVLSSVFVHQVKNGEAPWLPTTPKKSVVDIA